MILADVVNVGMMEGINQATSEVPVKAISSNIRTLRNGNRHRGLMIGVVRHTLGRRDSCQWCSERKGSVRDILTYLYL